MPEKLYRGGCLCGGVRYEIRGPLDAPIACHCSQCARTSGNYAAMAAGKAADLATLATTLAWYTSSEKARRGFCQRCGGNIFWQPLDAAGKPGADIYVTAGTLDPPTGLALAQHIHVASKSDFYEIADPLPQLPEW